VCNAIIIIVNEVRWQRVPELRPMTHWAQTVATNPRQISGTRFNRATLCIARYRKSVRPSVTLIYVLCSHGLTYDHDFFAVILVFWRQILSPYSTGWPSNSRTSGVGKNVVFRIKTARISETVSDTAKVTIDY